MGLYRAGAIEWPVRYRAAPPDTRFVPLGFERELSLTEILDQHPKGKEYGHIVRGQPAFPYLEDAAGATLSFPPVINSAGLGSVVVGDDHFFVELTGPHLDTLLLVASIAACDLADAGYTIEPVLIRYPYDTAHGRDVVTPRYFQADTSVDLASAERLLGEPIAPEEGRRLVQRMGSRARVEGTSLVLTPPPYRNDFLHAVDVVEEIAIGRGLGSFEPELPDEFTAGSLTAATRFSRSARDVLVGLGYQEMIFNYLGARRDYTERMNAPERVLVEVANPMTENYAVVRDSIIPCLLAAEMSSQNAAYPHRMFEVGKARAARRRRPHRLAHRRRLQPAGGGPRRRLQRRQRPPRRAAVLPRRRAPPGRAGRSSLHPRPRRPRRSVRPCRPCRPCRCRLGRRTHLGRHRRSRRTAPRRPGAVVARHALRRRRARPRHPPHNAAPCLTRPRERAADENRTPEWSSRRCSSPGFLALDGA